MTGNASGEGERVGDVVGNGDGDGVRANGDNGMCPTDFRRFDELFETFPVVTPLPLPGEKPARYKLISFDLKLLNEENRICFLEI